MKYIKTFEKFEETAETINNAIEKCKVRIAFLEEQILSDKKILQNFKMQLSNKRQMDYVKELENLKKSYDAKKVTHQVYVNIKDSIVTNRDNRENIIIQYIKTIENLKNNISDNLEQLEIEKECYSKLIATYRKSSVNEQYYSYDKLFSYDLSDIKAEIVILKNAIEIPENLEKLEELKKYLNFLSNKSKSDIDIFETELVKQKSKLQGYKERLESFKNELNNLLNSKQTNPSSLVNITMTSNLNGLQPISIFGTDFSKISCLKALCATDIRLINNLKEYIASIIEKIENEKKNLIDILNIRKECEISTNIYNIEENKEQRYYVDYTNKVLTTNYIDPNTLLAYMFTPSYFKKNFEKIKSDQLRLIEAEIGQLNFNEKEFKEKIQNIKFKISVLKGRKKAHALLINTPAVDNLILKYQENIDELKDDIAQGMIYKKALENEYELTLPLRFSDFRIENSIKNENLNEQDFLNTKETKLAKIYSFIAVIEGRIRVAKTNLQIAKDLKFKYQDHLEYINNRLIELKKSSDKYKLELAYNERLEGLTKIYNDDLSFINNRNDEIEKYKDKISNFLEELGKYNAEYEKISKRNFSDLR